MSMSVVANRVTSSTSSSSQIKQEHVKDENENSSRNSNNEDFFDDWKEGNWCWERDYNKHPVVVVSLPANNNNNNNCHDDGNGINDRSNDAKMNTTEHEQCDDDRKLCGSNIDERKPAAINYSSIDSSRRSVTTTASATMETAPATKKDAREISISKNPQIKVENNDEENTTNDINDFNNNNFNENNNNDDDDDDDDDSFYDDWVEGNWCLLDNSYNSNGEVEGKGNNDNSPRKMQHEITTTPSLRKKSRSNCNKPARRKLKRSRYDDDDDSYNEDDEDEGSESDYEDYNDDNKEEEEEEFIPEDNQGVHNQHQKDKRPVKKKSQRQTHYDNHRDQIWMGMFQKLVGYKKLHKNTTVLKKYKNDPKLGMWVYNQRKKYRNNKLLLNRIELLNTIGFEWDGLKGIAATNQLKWMNMFQKLVAYSKQHKTTMVPANYGEDPKLGCWLSEQRQAYREDKLLPNRCALLKSIGFELYISNYHQQSWMGMFQELVAYNEQHKNTSVPSRHSKLGRWVYKQRHFYKRGELLPARNALLKSIGFT